MVLGINIPKLVSLNAMDNRQAHVEGKCRNRDIFAKIVNYLSATNLELKYPPIHLKNKQ